LMVIERLANSGRGNTARSAAAYRDMFSSPVNRQLSQGSIAFYRKLQNQSFPIGLKNIGYLWLMRSAQISLMQSALTEMARAGVHYTRLKREKLVARLPNLNAGDLAGGIIGLNCGILNPNQLIWYYEQKSRNMGARLVNNLEVTGFTRNGHDRITGILAGGRQITAETIIIATGAWLNATLSLAGLELPVTPIKRQLFAVAAKQQPLSLLLHRTGFNDQNLLPLTILPDGVYLRPATATILLGYANPDQPAGLESRPQGELEFFRKRLRPQLVRYFPDFQDALPEYAWAGHYADYAVDRTPLVEHLAGAIIVGGTSGSGIMKADSLGRVVAGLYAGQAVVQLGDGQSFPVASLGLKNRAVPPEKFFI
jgi:FAD-dependent oxidoreductase domain-containing protein 1